MTMGREVSEEAPSAPESASTSTATTEVFHSLRRSLIAKFGKRGEVDAFQHLCDLVNVGVERRTMRSVLRNAHLRKFFGGVVSDDPALIRAYLDAKRGMKPPPAPTSEKDSPNKFSARMTARLTTDQTFFAHSAGALYRVPERITAQDLLAAMRRLEPPLPGVQHVSLAETRAFVAEWDSSDYVHRDAGRMHALDFAIFMRFADAANDVEGVTNDLGVFANPPGSFARTSARRATETVRRQAKDAVATKRKFATRDARREFVRREGEALVECLREELRVYETQRSPAVGGVEVPHAFKVEYAPGLGCVGKLTPEPTLALALAALDSSPRGATGFVSPSEARLALAQCRVPLTAVETVVLGDHLARLGRRSSKNAWDVGELLSTLECDGLPGIESHEDAPAVVRAWAAGARRAIDAEYLEGRAENDTEVELLRYLAAPADAAFGRDGVVKVVDASMAGYRSLARFFAALDNELGHPGGGASRGEGALTLRNVRYAGKMARCASPSTSRPARLETLADAFPAGASVDRTTGEKERRVDWRALMDACGPSAALLAQEKEAGAAAGSTVALRALAASATTANAAVAGCAPGIYDGVVVDADDEAFDGDVEAVVASLARHLFARVCDLRRELERADPDDRGYLATSAFGAAIAAAGYGPRTFGSAELRWAASACHHPFVEDAVLYPKYVAMVLVGIEREVYRRSDAAGERARAIAALAAEDAERSAWARETVRAAADAVKALEREVAARVSTR